MIRPEQQGRILEANSASLADALSKVKIERTELPADVTHGTRFYVPVVTLLAKQIHTRRQDLVYASWPVLGTPYHYFEGALPKIEVTYGDKAARIDFKRMLDTEMVVKQKPPVLWEIIDLLQVLAAWPLDKIVRWTREIERFMRREHPEVLMQLQVYADQVVKRHDQEGMLEPKVGLSPGVVVPVDGEGRVN